MPQGSGAGRRGQCSVCCCSARVSLLCAQGRYMGQSSQPWKPLSFSSSSSSSCCQDVLEVKSGRCCNCMMPIHTRVWLPAPMPFPAVPTGL